MTRPEKVRARSRAWGAAVSAFCLWLKSIPCMDCGLERDPELMDFDHRPGTGKPTHLCDLRGRSLTIIQQEVVKCDVVCVLCHRIRTVNRRREAARTTR